MPKSSKLPELRTARLPKGPPPDKSKAAVPGQKPLKVKAPKGMI